MPHEFIFIPASPRTQTPAARNGLLRPILGYLSPNKNGIYTFLIKAVANTLIADSEPDQRIIRYIRYIYLI